MILLIISGILLIIGGLIYIVQDVSYLSLLSWLGGGIMGVVVVEVIGGILMMVTGILALISCKKKERAGLLLKLGIVLIVFQIITWIWATVLFAGWVSVVSGGSVFFGIMMPILLIAGAYMNKKA